MTARFFLVTLRVTIFVGVVRFSVCSEMKLLDREEDADELFDKDFGELAWRATLPAASGVVLFRLPMHAAADAGAVLAARIGERADWAGHFSVVEPGRVRMRALSAK